MKFGDSLIQVSLVTLIVCVVNSELVLDSGAGEIQKELIKYFDIDNGFYVDIGAGDPIINSHTLSLYSQKWKGFNIDADPDKIKRFYALRPDQTNLNFFIGAENNKYVSVYKKNDGTVAFQINGNQKPLRQDKIPGITLKQACQFYFYKRPLFMNINVGKFSVQVIQSNNWKSSVCSPDVIFISVDKLQQADIKAIEGTLQGEGFLPADNKINSHLVFIHKNVKPAYDAKYTLRKQKVNKYTLQSLQGIQSNLGNSVNLPTISNDLSKNNLVEKATAYRYFTKRHQLVHLNKINQYSSLISQHKNNPIIIYSYVPTENFLVISEGTWKSEEIKSGKYQFLKITVTQPNGNQFLAFILNHFFAIVYDFSSIQVIVASQSSYDMFTERPKTSLEVINQIEKTLNSKGNENQSNSTLKLIISANRLQILAAQSNQNQKQMAKEIIEAYEAKQSYANEVKARVQEFVKSSDLKSIQELTIGLVLLMFCSICITIWIKLKKQN